jgi:hypothetical protein
MIDMNSTPTNYREAVDLLAAWQKSDDVNASEPDVTVLSLDDPEEKVVRFVEVSRDFGDLRESEHPRPVAMGASDDFPFRSELVLLSKSDWERVRDGKLPLPDGWDTRLLRLI